MQDNRKISKSKLRKSNVETGNNGMRETKHVKLDRSWIRRNTLSTKGILKQEGHDGPVSLHWPIREISSYQTLQYLEIRLKHKNPKKD